MPVATSVEALITLHEDRRTHPYLDNADPPKITIAIGRNLTDQGLREDEIDLLFRNDLAEVHNIAETYPWFRRLFPMARRAVVLDLIFNLGQTRFNGFKKFKAAMAVEDYETAALELIDSRWYDQVGTRGVRNVEIMRTGEWPET